MPIEEVEEVLKKFNTEEEVRNSKLVLQNKNDSTVTSTLQEKNRTRPTLEESRKRNQIILKELETVKGNLRSRAIFNPVEMQWKRICENYIAHPSLVITKWKCDIPIYV